MTKTLFSLACVAILSTTGAAVAEGADAQLNRCIANSTAQDTSAECVELRVAYLAEINDCTARRDEADVNAGASVSQRSSHGFKARYLICSASAKQKLGAMNP